MILIAIRGTAGGNHHITAGKGLAIGGNQRVSIVRHDWKIAHHMPIGGDQRPQHWPVRIKGLAKGRLGSRFDNLIAHRH